MNICLNTAVMRRAPAVWISFSSAGNSKPRHERGNRCDVSGNRSDERGRCARQAADGMQRLHMVEYYPLRQQIAGGRSGRRNIRIGDAVEYLMPAAEQAIHVRCGGRGSRLTALPVAVGAANRHYRFAAATVAGCHRERHPQALQQQSRQTPAAECEAQSSASFHGRVGFAELRRKSKAHKSSII